VSYELRALVAANRVAARLAARLPGSLAIPISQGLALVPMAGPWLSELAGSPPVFDELDDLQLNRELVALVEEVSREGPIAYLSIDEQSDLTWQGAAVWSEGRVSMPPEVQRPGEARGPEGGPVLAALRRLGVDVDPARSDFSEFGLYQRRRTAAWLEEPPTTSSQPGSPARGS
jgi:hypothetical protein